MVSTSRCSIADCGGLRIDGQGCGAEAVAEVVAGGVGFATGGDRPAGFCAVGARGGGAFFADDADWD
jgi:hypothetical protein